MAYHDENGKITIDEQAASKDIQRLTESAQVLRASKDAIVSLQRQAADMEGQISVSVILKSQMMEKRLNQMIEKLEYTAEYIRKTVRRYELLDEQIKQAIESAANAASAVIAASGVPTNVGTGLGTKPSSSNYTGTSGKGNSSTKKDLEKAINSVTEKAKDLFDSLF